MPPQQPPGEVSREAHRGDEHDHQPQVVGVERSVGPEAPVGHDREDHEREHGELQQARHVRLVELHGKALELRLVVQQRRHHDRHRDHDARVAVPERCPEAEGERGRHHRRGALVGRRDGGGLVGGQHAVCAREEARDQQPRRARLFSQHRAKRAEDRDEREGAHARLRLAMALALQADQKADGEAREIGKRNRVVVRHARWPLGPFWYSPGEPA